MKNYFDKEILKLFFEVRNSVGCVYDLCRVIGDIGFLRCQITEKIVKCKDNNPNSSKNEIYDKYFHLAYNLEQYATYKMFKLYNN